MADGARGCALKLMSLPPLPDPLPQGEREKKENSSGKSNASSRPTSPERIQTDTKKKRCSPIPPTLSKQVVAAAAVAAVVAIARTETAFAKAKKKPRNSPAPAAKAAPATTTASADARAGIKGANADSGSIDRDFSRFSGLMTRNPLLN